MKYITETTLFHIDVPTVVTIGKFDGRHRGHQKLMHQMMQVKKQFGYETAVLTFSIPPSVRVTGCDQPVLTTNLERRNNMKKTGIDWLVEYPFTERVTASKEMEAEIAAQTHRANEMTKRAVEFFFIK